MHILLLVTAHNSLSQRVALLLSDLSGSQPPTPSLSTSDSTDSEYPRLQAGPSRPARQPTEENTTQVRSPNKITYTIELASTPSTIIEAVRLAKPDVVLCPFLTKRVPREVYAKYLTLILHPGPPGDAGPSALDWVLSGDDGIEPDSDLALKRIMKESNYPMNGAEGRKGVADKGKEREGIGRREWWGVTCLQAEEELDEGPVWAFEQFRIPANATKSSLYRDGVTSAACLAILTALGRIEKAYLAFERAPPTPLLLSTPEALSRGRMPTAQSMSTIREMSALEKKPDFSNGHTPRYPTTLVPPADSASHTTRGHASRIVYTQHRPLLKPAERAPDPAFHMAEKCASLIRAGDSQPGVLTKMFGNKGMFIYGAHVQRAGVDVVEQLERMLNGIKWEDIRPGEIVATRQGAVLVKTAVVREGDTTSGGLAIWITHARLPMPKETKLLPPKLPACEALIAAGLEGKIVSAPEWDLGTWRRVQGTFQQVWVEEEKLECPEGGSVLYIHFDFYNGACSTSQCKMLLAAITDSLDRSDHHVRILCLMGSRNYFSNGIALNVIEGHADPSAESWRNIQAIDDIRELIMGDSSLDGKIYRSDFLRGVPTLAERGILTVSAIQANAAAGGLALATCADIALCSANAVLNPHYRGVGLFGSEFHTYHWPARVGQSHFADMAKAMMPLSPDEARRLGLIDRVIGSRLSDHHEIETEIKQYIQDLAWSRTGEGARHKVAPWVQQASGCSGFPGLSLVNTLISNKVGNHQALPFPLVFYRNEELSQMLLDFHHPSRSVRYHSRRQAFVRKFTSRTTPLRFAEHRRFRSDGLTHKNDPEELAVYEDAPGWIRGEEWRWAGECVPDGFLGFGGLEEIYSQFGGRDALIQAAPSQTAQIGFSPAPITVPTSLVRHLSHRKAVPSTLASDKALEEDQTSQAERVATHVQRASEPTLHVTNSEHALAAADAALQMQPLNGSHPGPKTKRDSLVTFGQAAPAVHRYIPASSARPRDVPPTTISALLESLSPPQPAVAFPGTQMSTRASTAAPAKSASDFVVNHPDERTITVDSSPDRIRRTSTWGFKGRTSRRPASSSGAFTPPRSFDSPIASADPSTSSSNGSGFRGSIRRAFGMRGSVKKMDAAKFEALQATVGQGYRAGAIDSPTIAFPQNNKKMQGHYRYLPAVLGEVGDLAGTQRENRPPFTATGQQSRKSLNESMFSRARVVSVEGKDGRVIMTHEEPGGHPEVLFPCYYTPMMDVGETAGAGEGRASHGSPKQMAIGDEP